MSDARVESFKKVADVVSIGVSGATLFQLLHLVLAIPAAIYMGFRCYEWLERRYKNKKGS